MSRSRRSETISLAFGIAGLGGGSSAGLVVADLKAASAMSRLLPPDRRVLSLDILGSAVRSIWQAMSAIIGRGATLAYPRTPAPFFSLRWAAGLDRLERTKRPVRKHNSNWVVYAHDTAGQND